jgi:hypothetical protein
MFEMLWGMEEEFNGVDLGDERLDARLLSFAEALAARPTASVAAVSETVAAREANYRFLENWRVKLEDVLAPHVARTVERCRIAEEVLVLHDTSEFTFSGEARGRKLGRVQGKQRGFLGHFALAVAGDGSRRPLGVLGVETIARDDELKGRRETVERKKDPNRESLRWARMVDRTRSSLEGLRPVHVMDREGDIYELLSELTRSGQRFVIRSGQDRLLVDEEVKLFAAIENGSVLLERDVDLSARPKVPSGKGRRQPARAARSAHLSVSARRVELRRPASCDSSHPECLRINVVHVFEATPPDGETPVQWVLLTSEPVETAREVAFVVDTYRARWVIEEFFKAVKTGCAYEERQLQSLHTLRNMLGVVAVIACRLLLVRSLDRDQPDSPATDVLDPILLEALSALLVHTKQPKPFPANPRVADVMKAIATLGGHHKSNGPAGWQILWRGFARLLDWASGYIAGKTASSRDQP